MRHWVLIVSPKAHHSELVLRFNLTILLGDFGTQGAREGTIVSDAIVVGLSSSGGSSDG